MVLIYGETKQAAKMFGFSWQTVKKGFLLSCLFENWLQLSWNKII